MVTISTISGTDQVVSWMSEVDQLVVDDDWVIILHKLVVLVREHDVVGPLKGVEIGDQMHFKSR